MLSAKIDFYVRYIQKIAPDFNVDLLNPLIEAVRKTNLDEPKSSQDCNNLAVMALIEAEMTEDVELKSFYLEIAKETLTNGVNTDRHPLCIAHLAILFSMTGDSKLAYQIAFPNFLKTTNFAYNSDKKIPLGLVYIPPQYRKSISKINVQIKHILEQKDGYNQSLLLLIQTLTQSTLVSYNQIGLRILEIATQVIPDSVDFNLNLGISNIINDRLEGLFYLQRARKLEPDNPAIIHALYLSYRHIQDLEVVQFWHHQGLNHYHQSNQSLPWQWATLAEDSPFSYVVFDDSILLAVEPSLRSYVTGVLLGQGDWFEVEMEFWRNQIKPEMVVVDVGANVGVYTFSAARRVGEKGRVFAVEPFSGCVEYMKETCRINNFAWVTLCQGAAGEANKTVKLSLHQASELNEIIKDESQIQGEYQEVNCFTLDSLLDKYHLRRVDWLKIDAEGYEINVLQGAGGIIEQYHPKIMYENQDIKTKTNPIVAEFLISRGYQLFYYQPFTEQLLTIESLDKLSGHLNIIALYQGD